MLRQRLRVLEAWIKRFVPEELAVDAEAARRAPLTVVLSFFLTALCIAFALVAFFLYDLPVIAAIDVVGAGLTFVTPFVLRATRSLKLATVLVLGVTVMTIGVQQSGRK